VTRLTAPSRGPQAVGSDGNGPSDLLARYGCGPVPFSGTDDALYERRLVFDHVVDPGEARPREQFEAVAAAIRDVLSQRWVRTQKEYDRVNPKQVYYLSMEFLIGRSLANNIANLMLSPLVDAAARDKGLRLAELLEQEPDAGLGNGGLGRLAACFIDSLATLAIPAVGYGLRYDYGIFRQEIRDGSQVEHPDHWLARPDPWEVARPNETVSVPFGSRF
jgi:glycogen phosphorylase